MDDEAGVVEGGEGETREGEDVAVRHVLKDASDPYFPPDAPECDNEHKHRESAERNDRAERVNDVDTAHYIFFDISHRFHMVTTSGVVRHMRV